MNMNQTQSILILLMLVTLAAFPAVLSWARRRDAEPQPNPEPAAPEDVEGVLLPRQAVAHHLYGEAVGWDPVAMADYDASPTVQDTWLAEADRRLHPAGAFFHQ